MSKKKFAYVSNMASPYQVKFCYALQEYFDTEFWFYVRREKDRPKWWEIPLGDKCKILKYSGRIPKIGYFSFGLFAELMRFKPDIVYLGGFMKWHWLVLKLVKLFSKKTKVIIGGEPMRFVKNDSSAETTLRNRENSRFAFKVLRRLFNNADLYIGRGTTAAKQFIEEIGFPKEKVDVLQYPQDIEEYFKHPLREKKNGDKFQILFASRLIDRYQPLFALEVFERVQSEYPNVEMVMNNDGPLKDECVEYIEKKGLKNLRFLDSIDSWNNMHLIYKDSDILILPATYSNGNLTIIEARASAMGIVISNKINHIEKHSINGKNCFICNLNVEEFSNAVLSYIMNPESLVLHGLLSREKVEAMRNKNIAEMYYEVFKKHDFVE
jgi:glycosyltransferase involved in cell wall biosynthesis